MSLHPHILIVEDDPEQANLYAMVLETASYEVETAPDAETGFIRMREHPADLVIIDWDLPGMKGDAFVLLLKEEFPRVLTVLYSNHAEIERAAATSGADAWLFKMTGIVRLRQLINELLPLKAA